MIEDFFGGTHESCELCGESAVRYLYDRCILNDNGFAVCEFHFSILREEMDAARWDFEPSQSALELQTALWAWDRYINESDEPIPESMITYRRKEGTYKR